MIVVTVRLYLKMVLLFFFFKNIYLVISFVVVVVVVSGLSCGVQFLSLWH